MAQKCHIQVFRYVRLRGKWNISVMLNKWAMKSMLHQNSYKLSDVCGYTEMVVRILIEWDCKALKSIYLQTAQPPCRQQVGIYRILLKKRSQGTLLVFLHKCSRLQWNKDLLERILIRLWITHRIFAHIHVWTHEDCQSYHIVCAYY